MTSGEEYGGEAFWLDSNRKVRQSGVINAVGCKIKVPSPWNVELFRELLVGHEDQGIVDFIEFGWPLDDGEQVSRTDIPCNQKGARKNLAKLLTYVEGEKSRGGCPRSI